MQTIHPRQHLAKHLIDSSGTILIVLGLLSLIACQGLSSAAHQVAQEIGNISWGSQSLSFGSVASNASKTMTVVATNSGNASLNITSAAFSTKYFSLASPALPITIAPGQNATLDVKFTPNAAGTFNAVATFNSDASNSVSNITLSGTGSGSAPAGFLAINPTSKSFGSVTVGNSVQQTVTVVNDGTTDVNVSQVSVAGSGFQVSGIATPITLTSTQSTTFTITFAPQSSASNSGTVTITSNGLNPSLTMGLTGTGVGVVGALGSNNSSIAFGSVTVANKQTVSETVTNNGGTSVTISQVGVSGTGFSMSGITTPVTLGSGQSATFSVSFDPPSAASDNGSLTVTSNASNPTMTVPLSGTGVAAATGQLSVTPSPLGVGSVTVGTSGTASGSLTASGSSVTVTAVGTNNSAFSVTGLSLPVTIPAGQSTPFTVTFSPQSIGSASATLTVTSNAQTTSSTDTLTGTGAAAPTHTVSLSWNASTSSEISGYNVYRAPYSGSCGSFAKINSNLNTTTLYTDSSVTDGSSYCYATTAVNTSSEESGYSNIVSNIQIPTP
jgi:Abnormal spindle-like microcephaly-assoc'd, ASPM-SPD-2-Hydin